MSSIEHRVESFFLLATLYDAENECLKPGSDKQGVHNINHWKEKMDFDLEWLHQHSPQVLLNLANLRKKWPACCEALEEILYSD